MCTDVCCFKSVYQYRDRYKHMYKKLKQKRKLSRAKRQASSPLPPPANSCCVVMGFQALRPASLFVVYFASCWQEATQPCARWPVDGHVIRLLFWCCYLFASARVLVNTSSLACALSPHQQVPSLFARYCLAILHSFFQYYASPVAKYHFSLVAAYRVPWSLPLFFGFLGPTPFSEGFLAPYRGYF